MKYRTLAVFSALVLALTSLAMGADVISIWGGARGSIILKSDGTVWTWGANFGGKLGIGVATTNWALVPTEVHGVSNVDYLNSITAIMGGEVHNVALKSDGTVWAWGSDFVGQLGIGTTNDQSLPVQVGLNSVPPLTGVTKLGGRPYFSLAVKSDGSIWAWGMNYNGQIGNGTVNTYPNPQVLIPVMVSNSQPGGAVNNPVQVSCGYTYGVALLTNGTVWTWGTGPNGELGNGTTGHSYTPVQVTGLSNVRAISCGWNHTLALKSDGTAWTWGLNNSGELGDGTTLNRSIPVQVINVSNIVTVSGGDWHSSALKADGTVWKWGKNDVGQLGLGMTNSSPNPVPAPIPGFTNVAKVTARDWHNIAVKSDGSVWAWGSNNYGQCGNNSTNDAWSPVAVVGMGARVGLPVNIKQSAQAGSADLSWNSSAGEYFSVECTTNLKDWTSVQSNILATPPSNTVTVSMTNSQSFYRLKF
jgi:alpha-tubulin suppressor-like RCC1 family protein